MATQEYPQLQPPGPGGPSPAIPPGYQLVPATSAAIPPLPPRSRGTGFWVGVTAAITVGVVAALLLGFFIGRGTRLSNAVVQSKITQQSQTDQLAQLTALDQQKTTFQRDEAQAITSARHNAYNQGYHAGYSSGQQSGYQSGAAAASAQAAANAQATQSYQTQLAAYDACLFNPTSSQKTTCMPALTPQLASVSTTSSRVGRM